MLQGALPTAAPNPAAPAASGAGAASAMFGDLLAAALTGQAAAAPAQAVTETAGAASASPDTILPVVEAFGATKTSPNRSAAVASPGGQVSVLALVSAAADATGETPAAPSLDLGPSVQASVATVAPDIVVTGGEPAASGEVDTLPEETEQPCAPAADQAQPSACAPAPAPVAVPAASQAVAPAVDQTQPSARATAPALVAVPAASQAVAPAVDQAQAPARAAAPAPVAASAASAASPASTEASGVEEAPLKRQGARPGLGLGRARPDSPRGVGGPPWAHHAVLAKNPGQALKQGFVQPSSQGAAPTLQAGVPGEAATSPATIAAGLTAGVPIGSEVADVAASAGTGAPAVGYPAETTSPVGATSSPGSPPVTGTTAPAIEAGLASIEPQFPPTEARLVPTEARLAPTPQPDTAPSAPVLAQAAAITAELSASAVTAITGERVDAPRAKEGAVSSPDANSVPVNPSPGESSAVPAATADQQGSPQQDHPDQQASAPSETLEAAPPSEGEPQGAFEPAAGEAAPLAAAPAESRSPPAVRGAPETVANLAAQIARRMEGQNTRFEIALDPHGMGAVQVSLEINSRGELSAHMAFEKPEAAAELRGRAAELQRALEQAGFDLSRGGLSFQHGGARDHASDQGQGRRAGSRAFQEALLAADSADAPPARLVRLRHHAQTGLDLRI